MIYFLFLSFLSGVIELGSVYVGIKLDLPVSMIMLLPFWYQLGNLLMAYIPKKRSVYFILSVLTIILSVINITNFNYYAFSLQLSACSLCIQTAREGNKKNCPAWLKRSARILGFATSPIMLFQHGQLTLIIGTLFATYLLLKMQNAPTKKRMFIQSELALSWVMIFHQLHYFVYTYIMPIYIYNITRSYLLSSISFAITWIVYLTPQTIIEKFSKINYKQIFFIGHSFLAICMGAMFWSSYNKFVWVVLLSWLLTGLGGGTVFCIKHLSVKYERINMDLSENIGHVLGPLIAIVISSLNTGNEIIYLSLASFCFVICAIGNAIIVQRKEN